MNDNTGHHQVDPGAYRSTGRPRHREDLAEDFRLLDDAQRAAAAAASPTARALIESSRAETYDRLAPLIADLDRTWNPATPPPPVTPLTIRTPRRDWSSRPTTSAEDTATTATVIDTDGTEMIDDSAVVVDDTADSRNRNRIIEIVVRAAHVVRHPRRQRQG